MNSNHTIEVFLEKSSFVDKNTGDTRDYVSAYAVVDGFMKIPFDRTKDNFRNLVELFKSGHTFTVQESVIEGEIMK